MKATNKPAFHVFVTVLLTTVLTAGCKESAESPTRMTAGGAAPEGGIVSGSTAVESGPSADDLFVGDLDVDASTASGTNSANDAAATDFIGKKVLREQNFQENFDDGQQKRRWGAKIYTDETQVLHGPYVEFYPDGTEFIRGTYTDGKRTGEWIYRNTKGNVGKQGSYLNEKLHGKWTFWHKDGSLEREAAYDNGKRHGHWVFYAKDGETVVREINFKNDRQDGNYVEYHPNGNKKFEATYKDGELHGNRQRWFEDGTQLSIESFQEGKKHGTFRAWNEAGSVVSEVEFRNGRRVSPAS